MQNWTAHPEFFEQSLSSSGQPTPGRPPLPKARHSECRPVRPLPPPHRCQRVCLTRHKDNNTAGSSRMG
jgi:hypothetical protein